MSAARRPGVLALCKPEICDAVPIPVWLLRQEAGAIQPQLEQLQAQVAQAGHRLQELVKGPRAAEISKPALPLMLRFRKRLD